MRLSELRIGGILPLVLFLAVFTGILYFMGFKLMVAPDTPLFVVAIFLAFATFMAVVACRTAAKIAAGRRDSVELRAWKWGGTALAVILMLPLYLEALFG